jgi:hypothetical protein
MEGRPLLKKQRASSTKRKLSRVRNYSTHNSKQSYSSLKGFNKMFNQGNLTNIRVSGVLSHPNNVGGSGDYSQVTDIPGFNSHLSGRDDASMMAVQRGGRSSQRPSTQNSVAMTLFGQKHKLTPSFTNNYGVRRKKLKS